MPSIVSCGAQFTLAISKRGNLYGWGANHSGQLSLDRQPGPDSTWVPVGDTNRPVRAVFGFNPRKLVCIASGGHHTLAIDREGVLYSCGRNVEG